MGGKRRREKGEGREGKGEREGGRARREGRRDEVKEREKGGQLYPHLSAVALAT